MNSRFFLWYCLVWVGVIFLSLTGSYFNAVLLDAPFSLVRELPFMARWLVWIPLTPLAVYLAGKMGYTDNKIGNFASYHLSIYLLLCAIHIFAASITAFGINSVLGGHPAYILVLKKCAITGVFYNFIIYGILLLLVNGARYYEALQQERLKIVSLEKSLSDSRLMFLKQQLQPHFLFNTHHSIITLIKSGEKNKAAAMLEKLSDLMRIALQEGDTQQVTIDKELETLRLYVDIQKTRFEDRMTLHYQVAGNTLHALVPSMILQPLVENSIKYAVERSAMPGSITVGASADDVNLNLVVRDCSRQSMPGAEIKKGTGLANTQERLRQLYGDAAAFSIFPYSRDGNAGMEVNIKIPLQYATL